MKITFKLDAFEGPLDLLLHLIEQAEVDIYDIPIKQITDQYLNYLLQMQELELEITSEFLVMAATLLSIKSRMLLPKPPPEEQPDDAYEDDGEDPRSELVQRLLEYRKYKLAADFLQAKETERNLVYTREALDLTPFQQSLPDNPVHGIELTDLLKAYRRAMRRLAEQKIVAKIHRDEISVKDRMVEVIEMLNSQGGRLLFSQLVGKGRGQRLTRHAIVVSFLALLELMKLKRVTCYQHQLYGDIVIEAKEGEMADGLAGHEIDY